MKVAEILDTIDRLELYGADLPDEALSHVMMRHALSDGPEGLRIRGPIAGGGTITAFGNALWWYVDRQDKPGGYLRWMFLMFRDTKVVPEKKYLQIHALAWVVFLCITKVLDSTQ